MNKKLILLAMLAAITRFWMPSASEVSAQNGNGMRRQNVTINQRSRQWRQIRNNGNNGTWRKKNAHGYKNYGQYRRTQVGNRRHWNNQHNDSHRNRRNRRDRDN